MSSAPALKEAELKCLFLESLRSRQIIDERSVIASEFALGRTGRRVDLAVWSREFIGIEFKSKFDTLRRLPPQLDAYLQCFDRVVFVVDQKHGASLKDMPPEVEVWIVDGDGNLSLVQRPGVIRSKSTQALANLCSLSQLRRLTRSEASGRSYRGRTSISSGDLVFDDVYEAAIDGFKKSFAPSSKTFWSRVENSKIHPDHLVVLSRYAEQRTRRAIAEKEQQSFWQSWSDQATKCFAQNGAAFEV